ncbi:DNA-binding IscR family transcriptional regulator [Paenibacillus shirakamiensis]|uniref:DNA-binding IscR family transcriptional regulator n=1 Tax=Paenibacillus shirakamiensis TaxID=1265935 RepID=A0ABS4JJM3_9BACL|nr:Rrf2 family transcriptional regulator [Paenibacillus shirakamiensis]MBP2001904.1 DNA-binding IscR family transcriptional regulator [Paenibacillus shirakamiensis]
MAISSRFSVAVHILSLIDLEKGRITSEYIAGSVNTNPVVIRRIIGMLSRAELLTTSPGVPGAKLTRPLSHITLLEVYQAVQIDISDDLFSIHGNPNPDCGVGRNIQSTLESSFHRAQQAMEKELAQITMDEVVSDLSRRMAAD